ARLDGRLRRGGRPLGGGTGGPDLAPLGDSRALGGGSGAGSRGERGGGARPPAPGRGVPVPRAGLLQGSRLRGSRLGVEAGPAELGGAAGLGRPVQGGELARADGSVGGPGTGGDSALGAPGVGAGGGGPPRSTPRGRARRL